MRSLRIQEVSHAPEIGRMKDEVHNTRKERSIRTYAEPRLMVLKFNPGFFRLFFFWQQAAASEKEEERYNDVMIIPEIRGEKRRI